VGNKVADTDEFKQALIKEQQRLRKESAIQYELKLAELERERKSLESEKREIQQQKLQLAQLNFTQETDSNFVSSTFPLLFLWFCMYMYCM
jgi:hypothetical protein